MFHKKMKQMGAWLLAFSMVLGSAQLPAIGAKAAEGNLALNATATASGVEADTLPAGKANDGDVSTRWASPVSSDAQWLQLSWDTAQTMKSFSISWERRNATNYAIEISNDGTTWEAVKSFTEKPQETTQQVTLAQAVQAKYVRLNITAHDSAGLGSEVSWNNVSVYEFEVYEGEIPDTRSDLEKLVGEISQPVISADGSRISMPETAAGITVRFCADYEQVIGEDGTIYTPVEDKVVKGFYELSDGENTAKTSEYTITVPGQYTDDANANAKPSVIPELQEWHGTAGQFAISSLSKIVAGKGLEDTAARFAEDYKEITGMDISVVSGDASDAEMGDFYLTLVEDTQGLGKEGYIMTVGNSVKIEASDATGAYWGVVSVLQILKQTNGTIAKGIARDYPKYEVRGFSLDVGRKPFSIETLNEFSKNMAWYKMNSFQVHLSDNLIFHEDYATLEEAAEQSYAGFRLESDKVNEETGVALTSEDMYYTKAEFKDFIKNSQAMGVNIVPEFDMPAHCLAITRVYEEYMSKKAGGSHGYLIEELNLENDEAFEWAKSIWEEYFDGEDAVFADLETVHIGTDEYHGTAGQTGVELFRRFSAEMIEYVESKGKTVRMWGSLTNKAGTTEVPSENVQLNIWNTGYANPQTMYDLGYDLINTLEGPNYIVPAAGYYNDYINAQSIYNTWKPNVISSLTVSAGSDQMLGGCYAIWHDSIDTRANGISEYDSFDRFFTAVPAYGAKLWGEAEDNNYQEFTEITAKTGTAPGTTVYGAVDSATGTILDYTFDEAITKDSSANSYDGTNSENVSQVDADSSKALQLNGGSSYVETPEEIDKIGENASITLRVKMDADAEGEQILCESKDEFGAYGTYAIKAVQKNTGKVGFSREGYDYSFDYELPAGEWVELTFQGGKDNVSLYVDGELVDNNPDIYFANHPTTELSAKLASHSITKICTMLVPIGRIGSKTKSFKGAIDYVTVSTTKESSLKLGVMPQSKLTAGACSTHATEGSIEAMLDGDSSTYWHTDYASSTEQGTGLNHNHYITLTLDEATTINKLTYLPRQDNTNGRITEYRIDITKADGTEIENYASGTWASDMTEKSASFAPIEAKSVKLVILASGSGNHGTAAELNLYEPVDFGSSDLQAELDKYADYEESEYMEMGWNTFVRAREEALAVVKNASSTQNDYLYAYEQLQKAAVGLAAKTADIKLNDVIKGAEQVSAEDYAPAGYAAYQQAVADAKKVLNDESATDAQKLAAIQAIEIAKAALIPKTQEAVTNLNTAIADAEKLLANTTGYTADSVAALQKAVAAAKAVLADSNATQAQIEAALKVLQNTKLVKKSEDPGTTITPPPVTTPAVPAAGAVTTVKNIQYKVTKSDAKNGTVTVVKAMNKNAKKVVIPATVTIDGYTFKVTAVNAKAFQNAKKLTAVTVGANVKKIGAKAFFKCTKLKKVIFKGTKAPKIGKQTFKGTAVKCKVTTPKKMVKKQKNVLKTRLRKAGLSKKATVK